MSDPRKCPKCGAALAADEADGPCPQCLLNVGLKETADVSRANVDSEPLVPPSPKRSGFVPPSVAEIAGRFPQLEIIDLLGIGGMGAVYKARQPNLDRLVALKILPPETDTEAHFAERFTREARAMAKLSHPNIVAIYEFGQAAGLFFFIMEYVDGVNLRHALKSGAIKTHESLAIVPQICDALQYAHDEGVVHRDIKPENILLDKKGRVKIVDFGLAKLLKSSQDDHSLTGSGHVMGTLHYMAPEQMENPLSVDSRADVYSLGVVFYEMLTGELPLGRFALPSHKVQMDVRLDEVVLRSLEKERHLRYQHASDVKTDVIAITSSDPGTAKTLISAARSEATRTAPRVTLMLVLSGVWAIALWADFLVFRLVRVDDNIRRSAGVLIFGLLVCVATYAVWWNITLAKFRGAHSIKDAPVLRALAGYTGLAGILLFCAFNIDQFQNAATLRAILSLAFFACTGVSWWAFRAPSTQTPAYPTEPYVKAILAAGIFLFFPALYSTGWIAGLLHQENQASMFYISFAICLMFTASMVPRNIAEHRWRRNAGIASPYLMALKWELSYASTCVLLLLPSLALSTAPQK